MDCGPAAVKALLEGCGIQVSYGRLREACQTSVDGTSIDTIEDVLVQLGLDAEQVMLPADHLLLPEAAALPALVVVRLPNGLTHFIIVWNTFGPWVQIMDPGVGRRWVLRETLRDQLFHHRMPVPAAAWRAWAASPLMLDPLRARLAALGAAPAQAAALIGTALADPGWRGLAALDGAVRFTAALVRSGGVERAHEAVMLIERLAAANTGPEPESASLMLPGPYCMVTALADDPEQIVLQGAVLIRIIGRRDAPSMQAAPDDAAAGPIAPELLAALREPEYDPEREIWQRVRQDGITPMLLIALGIGIGVVGVLLQTVLLQGIVQVSAILPLLGDPALIVAGGLLFLGALLVLNTVMAVLTQRIGRRLEIRLRIAFFEKLPRLSDRYFHSRLISDMAHRAHELRSLRGFPAQVIDMVRTGCELLFTAGAVIALRPDTGVFALVASGLFLALTQVTRPFLHERSLRLRTHGGALARFYLDAMQGLLPLRTHSAERAFRREYEGLLIEWMRANTDYARVAGVVQALGGVLYTACALWIVSAYLQQTGQLQLVFLILFWTLRLPALGSEFLSRWQTYPLLRNTLLRVLEPLGTPEAHADANAPAQAQPVSAQVCTEEASAEPQPVSAGGAAIVFERVRVVAGGHTLLDDLMLHIAPGEHVAIVGASGAGKSTLIGLLLGWHTPAQGVVRVDGHPLVGDRLAALRAHTAWVDPAVQVWNRSLRDNLTYGGDPAAQAADLHIEQAELLDVVERLPQGMQTPLGESGGLVSGGEGQRVRLARAFNRTGVRLALLDEPFRGLDREKRRLLLARARAHWAGATLLCVTHDVGETGAFDRVLVVDHGRVVEDAPPSVLAARSGSRYRALLDAERAVRETLWQGTGWRHITVADGQVEER
jgi:ATP-binding cassette subfamily B protein